MARRPWSSRGNPPKRVADRLGVSIWDFSEALHKIKQAARLRGADNVSSIWEDGSVTDAGGEMIGNIYDEI